MNKKLIKESQYSINVNQFLTKLQEAGEGNQVILHQGSNSVDKYVQDVMYRENVEGGKEVNKIFLSATLDKFKMLSIPRIIKIINKVVELIAESNPENCLIGVINEDAGEHEMDIVDATVQDLNLIVTYQTVEQEPEQSNDNNEGNGEEG